VLALANELEVTGFPCRWTPAEQDAVPAYWMQAFLVYWSAKHEFEAQQIQAAGHG
jgi:hypothetical protein